MIVSIAIIQWRIAMFVYTPIFFLFSFAGLYILSRPVNGEIAKTQRGSSLSMKNGNIA